MAFPDLDPVQVFRDFTTNGVPASGKWDPRKVEIRRLLKSYESAIIALIGGEGGDIDLVRGVISFSVTGGTANDIIAEPDAELPENTGSTIFILGGIAQENTGPVTINGKPLLTNSGNEIAGGGLVAGGIYLFLDDGTNYRLVSDQASAAIVAAAEHAAGVAVTAASDAEDAKLAAESAAGANLSNADSVAAAEATNVPTPVNYIRTAGHAAPGDGGAALYRRALTEPSHAGKFQSADGAWWELAENTVHIAMLGGFPGAAPSTNRLAAQAMYDLLRLRGGGTAVWGEGVYEVDFAGTRGDFNTCVLITAPRCWTRGAGKGVTVIKAATGADATVLRSAFAGVDGIAADEYMHVSDLTIDGNWDEQTWAGPTGLEGDGIYDQNGLSIFVADKVLIERVAIQNVAQDGLTVGTSGNVEFSDIDCENTGKGGVTAFACQKVTRRNVRSKNPNSSPDPVTKPIYATSSTHYGAISDMGPASAPMAAKQKVIATGDRADGGLYGCAYISLHYANDIKLGDGIYEHAGTFGGIVASFAQGKSGFGSLRLKDCRVEHYGDLNEAAVRAVSVIGVRKVQVSGLQIIGKNHATDPAQRSKPVCVFDNCGIVQMSMFESDSAIHISDRAIDIRSCDKVMLSSLSGSGRLSFVSGATAEAWIDGYALAGAVENLDAVTALKRLENGTRDAVLVHATTNGLSAIPFVTPSQILFTAALPGSRQLALQITNARAGLTRWRVAHNGSGNNWAVAQQSGGTITTLTPGQWCDVIWDGANYALCGKG